MRSSVAGNRGSPWRAALAALAVLGATTVSTVVAAGPAQARCNGVNNPVTIILRDSAGNSIGREGSAPGTCDNNGLYTGTLQDLRDDGSCVELYISQEAGGLPSRLIIACRPDAPVTFEFVDPDSYVWFSFPVGGSLIGRPNFGF